MQRTFIKVCGLTSAEQVDWAIELGYDAVGFVVSARSKRYCDLELAAALAQRARGRAKTFAVALTYSELASNASSFDTIQLYEMADIPNLAYSSGAAPSRVDSLEYFFYDASVGSGVFKEIPLWVQEIPGKVVIAGGLDAENVGAVIQRFRPYGVDVSSSVEVAPGIKSYEKMSAFIAAVTASANCQATR